jgi:ribonuclease BN (tRNA processing enzyme)
MFTQKHMKKYTTNICNKELTFIGISRAAKATCFYVPELKLMLDAGYPIESMPNIVVITHLHWDHIAEIMRVMLSSDKNKNPLIIICPNPSVLYLKNLIESSYRATKLSDIIKYPQYAIIGFKENSSIILDISRKNMNIIGCKDTTIQNGDFIKYEDGNILEQLSKMSYPIEIRGIVCVHSQITLGYGFIELRSILKDEYIYYNEGKKCCKLSSEELTTLKKTNKINEYMQIKYVQLFAFLCDTNHMVFDNISMDYPIIIIECTFFKDNDINKAKKKKHMHWKHLETYVKKYTNIQFKLIHFSEKYSINDLCNFKKQISSYNNVDMFVELSHKISKISKIQKIPKIPKIQNSSNSQYIIDCYDVMKIPFEKTTFDNIIGQNIKTIIKNIYKNIQKDIQKNNIQYYLFLKNINNKSDLDKYYYITREINIIPTTLTQNYYKIKYTILTKDEFDKIINLS